MFDGDVKIKKDSYKLEKIQEPNANPETSGPNKLEIENQNVSLLNLSFCLRFIWFLLPGSWLLTNMRIHIVAN